MHRAALEPGALRARRRRDGLLLGGARVLPGHELLEPALRRAHRPLPDDRPQQPVPRARAPGPRRCWAPSRLWRRRERPSREAVALGVIGLVAVLVALGPTVRLFGADLASRALRARARGAARVPDDPGHAAGPASSSPCPSRCSPRRPSPAGGRGAPVLVGVFALALAEGVWSPHPHAGTGRRSSTRAGSRPPVYRWLRAQPAGIADRRPAHAATSTAWSGGPPSTRASTWSTRPTTGCRS